MNNKEQKKDHSEQKKPSQEELKQALEEKYMEYQMVQEQLNKMTEQSQTLQKQAEELDGIKEAIKNIEKAKIGTEMFVPISAGIFIKAEIKETKEVLMNVGNNVVVPKSISSAVELIKKQQTEIEAYEKTMQQNIQILLLHQQRIESELSAFVKQNE